MAGDLLLDQAAVRKAAAAVEQEIPRIAQYIASMGRKLEWCRVDAADVRLCAKTSAGPDMRMLTLWAMCGRIWTPPDCNIIRHIQDQRPQLLTYIRLPDAA
jgi:hypothetical protein